MVTVVYCERKRLHACELIGEARKFSARLIALCEAEDSAEVCLASGADEAVVFGCVEDDCAQGQRIARALTMLAPDSALFPATVRGRFLSACAAAILGTGLTADCTALGVTADGLLLQSRPAFGGNLTADILCRDHRPQMASVRPGVFPMPERLSGKHGPVRLLEIDAPEERLRRTGFKPGKEGVSLPNARVIVAGGKGVGSARGFEKLGVLAKLLGGAVGATRSAVDAGLIGYEHQIGQTGVTVRPRLYLAFGISGAVQHTVGMHGAETVLAVNTERTAPIFACADWGIIADWETTADKLIDAFSKRNHSSEMDIMKEALS